MAILQCLWLFPALSLVYSTNTTPVATWAPPPATTTQNRYLRIIPNVIPRPEAAVPPPPRPPLEHHACQFKLDKNDPAQQYKGGFASHSCRHSSSKPGTCMIIEEPMPLHLAVQKCVFNYGGVLAFPREPSDLKSWNRAIFYRQRLFRRGAKFWIGAYPIKGEKNLSYLIYDPYDTYVSVDYNYIDLLIKNKTRLTPSQYPFAKGEPKMSVAAFSRSCRYDSGIYYNRRDAKWYSADATEQLYSMCEVPRWPKLKCPRGWILVMQVRTCLKFVDALVTFAEAAVKCRKMNSILAIETNFTQMVPLLTYQYQYDDSSNYWIGLRVKRIRGVHYYVTFDGSDIEDDTIVESVSHNTCGYVRDTVWYALTDCNIKRGYICMQMVDQSMANLY